MEPEPLELPARRPSPVDPGERLELLDALRGFALGGVFVSNVHMWFSGRVFLPVDRFNAVSGDTLSMVLGRGFMFVGFGKFMTIFGALFGLGFAVQMMRAEERGSSINAVYARRLGVLLAIGLAHMFGVWLGDILTMYALMGFGLLLFQKRSNRALVLWGFGLILIGPLIVNVLERVLPTLLLSEAALKDSEAAHTAQLEAARAGMYAGMKGSSYIEMLKANAAFVWHDLVAWKSFSLLSMILGKFLLGFYAGRRRLFHNVAENRGFFRRMLGWGLAVGITASSAQLVINILIRRKVLDPMAPWRLAMFTVHEVGYIALAMAYVATFVLLFQRPLGKRVLSLLAPAGRMALSNYLFQSVIGLFTFYGFGLGLAGEWGPARCIPLAMALFTAQIALSHLWLSRFRFGPAEWLWRTLTYGKAQPMLAAPKAAPITDPATATDAHREGAA